MILSRKFVSDYIDLDKSLSIEQIAEDMTRVGNEYDSCGNLINATNLIVGEVIECDKHPDSDHLNICKVNIGSEVLNIVCGAPNVRKGLKVIVALPGAVLPDGEIKKGVIRGQESNGMICSIKELGLDNKFLRPCDIEGIHEFDMNVKVGGNPIEYLGLDDEIIDFELTANRGDELSMLGLAYELGAIYNKKVKDVDISYSNIEDNVEKEFSLDIKTDNCKLFLAKKVKDITIKESPDFIKNRLIACGIRPINNVVDISNYVMLETGQPLHFYDADRLGNKIVVRMAKDGEKLMTLDNTERVLSKNDIVIANDKESVGLAGVMGGLSTEVEDDTKNIIIEAAIFDSVCVRKTSKKVLRSEASNRFEKGLDPSRTFLAMERACNLLEKYAGGKILDGMCKFQDIDIKDKEIFMSVEDVNLVLGTDLNLKIIKDTLERLGFKVSGTSNKIKVIVPSRRIDISIKEDLIEEIGRIYGINNIKGVLPVLQMRAGSCNKTIRNIRQKLVDLGLNEVLTQVFITEEDVHRYTLDKFDAVKLLDPLSVEKDTLRYSLLSSMMKVYNYNKAHNTEDIFIFEIAKCFYKKDNNYGETNKIGIMMNGDYYYELGKKRRANFYTIKGIIEELLCYLGFEGRYSFEVDSFPNEFHPYQSAYINVSGKRLGIIGKVHPNYVNDDLYMGEIDLDSLLSIRTGDMKYREYNKFPSMKKDFSIIVDKDIVSMDIISTIKKVGGKLLTNIEIFDLYEGKNIDDGKVSLAFSLTFEDNKRTLTDDEVNVLFSKIIDEVVKKYKAVLRDK